MEKISVIVPVYKVEEYLRKCVDSIINQSHSNLEIILVDDGSPDNCPAICDDYAKIDSRVKVIHKTNGGLSDARNAGLDIAAGEYIFFVDSDDWIENNTISECRRVLIEQKADAVITMFYNSVGEISTKRTGTGTEGDIQTLGASEALAVTMFERLRLAAWGNLYKKSLFDGMRFKKGYIYEDLELLPKMLLKAEKITLYYKAFYNYLEREGSIMRGDIKVSEQMAEIADENLAFIEKQAGSGEHAEKIALGLLFLIMNWHEQAVIFRPDGKINPAFEKQSRRLLKKNIQRVISSPHLGFKRKAHYLITAVFPYGLSSVILKYIYKGRG